MESSTKYLLIGGGALLIAVGIVAVVEEKKAKAASSPLNIAAQNAVDAINGDSSYCTSVGVTGSAVNSAVHDFKLAWNAANPGNPVPIDTGKYEAPTAAAIASLLGSAPAACA